MPTNHSILKTLKEGPSVRVVIDEGKCIECRICCDVCPLTQIMGFESLKNEFIGSLCTECGPCVAVCSREAITINGLGAAGLVQEFPSSETMLNLIKGRRSIRAFKDKEIEQETWEKLTEAVRYSPTGHNTESVGLIIVKSPQVLQSISKIAMGLFDRLAKHLPHPIFSILYKKKLGEHTFAQFFKLIPFFGQQKEAVEQGLDPILYHAPGLILFIAPKGEMMSQLDADFAAHTVALYAPTLGLGTCCVGFIMAAFGGLAPSVREVVPIPEGYDVFNALVIGYPKHDYPYLPARKERLVHYL